MKAIIRNSLFGVFIFSGTMAIAQQNSATTVHSSNSVAPAAQATTITSVNGNVTASGYVYSDGNFKEYQEKDLKSKEVSKEISITKGADVYIENSSRAVVVKTWDQPKVKVTTTVYYDGESKLTDDEWLEKVNLSLKTLGNSVKIKSGGINYSSGGGLFYSYNNGSGSSYSVGGGGSNVAVFNGNGQNIGTRSNMKRIVTVTVPAGSKLDIESKYADITLPAGINDVNLDISNGNLEAENLGKMILRSKYSNVNIGDVKNAEVEFSNGRFSAKSIDDLDIESNHATVEMAAAKKLMIRSSNDEYEIEDAGEVRGRKTYGNLRITKLTNSIDIDGQNADVKVRNVGAGVNTIKIANKYADIRIPLRETKNYFVDFTGSYSSVYGNFDKKPVEVKDEKTGDATAPAAGGNNQLRVTTPRAYAGTLGTAWGNDNPSKFTATVGDGKGLKIDMKCQNCTVDFK